MELAITIIGILLIILSVFLVIAVLMQSSKDHRLGGSIAGGAETFFGKTKGKSMDAMFNKLTTVIAIVFVVLVLVLYFIAPNGDTNADLEVTPVDLEEATSADLEATTPADLEEATPAELETPVTENGAEEDAGDAEGNNADAGAGETDNQ